MFIEKLLNIKLWLPTADDPSAGKKIIFGSAENEINIAPYSRAANYFLVILLDHISIPVYLEVSPQQMTLVTAPAFNLRIDLASAHKEDAASKKF
jgi:hypothetical protein